MIDQESHYDIAARLSINWMNGNLSDTIEEILSYEPIDSSVILDDDRLELRRDQSDPVLDLHFVRTSWLDGLQDHHIEKAIKILDEVKFNLNVVKRGTL